MEPIATAQREDVLVVVDSAAITDFLEGHATLARRFRPLFDRHAASAARLRAALKLKLPDAVQAASALAVNAEALVTHDRDFSRLTALRVLG